MLDDFVDLVKGQVGYYERQISLYHPNHPKYKPNQISMYQELLERHQKLLEFLEGLETSAAPTVSQSASKVIDDLSDLPPELLEQLSDSATRGQTDILVKIIADRGGIATLDQILIDLYRKHGEVGKRTLIQNRLYRLYKNDGVIWPVPKKKGVYTTIPQGEVSDDAE